MSVLETPRIYFQGEISWDPITTNNYVANYDEGTGRVRSADVRAFRKAAIDQVTAATGPSNWNPHGTHRATFFNTKVTGFDLGTGLRIDDPFVGVPVGFTGMLVDGEPYGSISSQLFFDSMQFGIRGGYRIAADRSSRIIARYINMYRNLHNKMRAGRASVVWQTSFTTTADRAVDPHGSGALDALRAAMTTPGVRGLTVRFTTYRTVYFDDPTLRNGSDGTKRAEHALQAKLAAGFQPNPARSLLVGVVGLWREGEPAQEPGDRALLSAVAPPSDPNVDPPGPVPGSAYARVGRTSLVIDLANTVPEKSELAKEDLGTLNVTAVDPDSGAATTLGTIPYDRYDRDAYERSAGIVTLPLADGVADRLSTQHLRVTQADDTPLLIEAPARAVPLTPCRYLDEGDRQDVVFQVYERGIPAGPGLRVDVYQVAPPRENFVVRSHRTLETDAAGRVSFPVTADAGKVVFLVPLFATDEPPENQRLPIRTQINTYACARVHPADVAVGELEPTWENVYSRVLANWDALAPCMDNWLRLSDTAQVTAFAPVLRKLTDPAMFESYWFMPVTRDMSAGQRTLLHRFLDAPE